MKLILFTAIKSLLVLFTLVCLSSSGQDITIKEIRLKPNPDFYSINKETIIYPIILTGNVHIDSLINTQTRDDFFEFDYENKTVNKLLEEQVNEDGLINLSYEVTYKNNGLLSFNIYLEGCGAYCSSGYKYFNYDLKTGKKIEIADLIIENKINNFKKLVFDDKVKMLNEYKKEETDYFLKNEIDSDTYNWAIEEVDRNCIANVQIDKFSLSNLCIAIQDDCEFPHAIKSQQPVYDLKYEYSFISAFLKPEYKKIFLK